MATNLVIPPPVVSRHWWDWRLLTLPVDRVIRPWLLTRDVCTRKFRSLFIRIIQFSLSSTSHRSICCPQRLHTVSSTNRWGDKENGVAGHGDTEGHQYTPKLLERLSGKNVVQISACGFHTGCLTDLGEVRVTLSFLRYGFVVEAHLIHSIPLHAWFDHYSIY